MVVVGEHDEVGDCTLFDAGGAEVVASVPRRGTERVTRGQPGAPQIGDLLGDDAVGTMPASVPARMRTPASAARPTASGCASMAASDASRAAARRPIWSIIGGITGRIVIVGTNVMPRATIAAM
jgi:hypothetical protein